MADGTIDDKVWEHISIQPGYGSKRNMVSWRLSDPLVDAEVLVYFSKDGLSGWDLRNETDPVRFHSSYEDTDVPFLELSHNPHYRLLAIKDGQTYPSEPIGIFESLTRKDYGAIRKMMLREFQVLRKSGIQMWMFPPLTSGEHAKGIDPMTGQMTQTECAVSGAISGFGTFFAGGFGPPVLTWVRIDSPINNKQDDDPQRGAATESVNLTSRFLAFPTPVKGFMLASPVTDNRYVVSAVNETYAHRGVYPVAHSVAIELLDRADLRYNLTIPPLPV